MSFNAVEFLELLLDWWDNRSWVGNCALLWFWGIFLSFQFRFPSSRSCKIRTLGKIFYSISLSTWILLDHSIHLKWFLMFHVVCYYFSTDQCYSFCDRWALLWRFRLCLCCILYGLQFYSIYSLNYVMYSFVFFSLFTVHFFQASKCQLTNFLSN
jgi:hypothetical protein